MCFMLHIRTATTVGGRDNGVSPREADILLTVGLYHLTGRAGSASTFLSAGSVQTVLGDLTGERWLAHLLIHSGMTTSA